MYLNQLEPDALIAHFLAHPPVDFVADRSPSGAPYFIAEFDLLTTTDESLRRRAAALPFYARWSQWLKPLTCFVGTTVSEYTLMPEGIPAADLVAELKREYSKRFAFVIIKDIPQASPLLDEASNRYAHELTRSCQAAGFTLVEGQALAWVPIDFASETEYLERLSKSRRKNIRRKLKSRDDLDISTCRTGDACYAEPAVLDAYYALYLSVYAQSEIHFDLLTPEFFAALLQDASSGGIVFEYRHQGELIAYNICFVVGDTLVDKYIGFSYPQARDHNLYCVSWFSNLAYARENGLSRYIAGWTDPQVKADLGAQFTLTRHAVHIRNPILRFILSRLASLFESDHQWSEQHLKQDKT